MMKNVHPSTAPRQSYIIGAFIAVSILLLAHQHGGFPKSAWFRINFNMAAATAAASPDKASGVAQDRQQQLQQPQSPGQTPTSYGEELKAVYYLPDMLSSMLVCITFKWNPAKLVYLTTVLQNVATYRTAVDILIVTDQDKLLRTALHGMSDMAPGIEQVEVWQPDMNDVNSNAKSAGRFWLTYQHRHAIESRLKQKDYSTVLYVEDDTYLSWPAVVSWALDTQLLQPLNFTRCFYRTEVHHLKGIKVMLDWEVKENITEVPKVDVRSMDSRSRARYMALSQQLQGQTCGQFSSGIVQPCDGSLHRHFLSPTFPFQGMWMLNRQQLAEFMQHPYWTQNASVHAYLGKHSFWGYPERSNSMHMFVHVPKGFATKCMVPYFPAGEQSAEVSGSKPADTVGSKSGPKLSAVAEVKHLRNGYGTMDCIPNSTQKAKCAKNQPDKGHFALSSIPVDEALIQ